MEKNEEKVLERNLEQKHFEDAAKAIEGGKERLQQEMQWLPLCSLQL